MPGRVLFVSQKLISVLKGGCERRPPPIRYIIGNKEIIDFYLIINFVYTIDEINKVGSKISKYIFYRNGVTVL